MGKRIEITPYRPKKVHAATASTRIKPFKMSDPVSDEIASGMSYINEITNQLEAYKAAERAKVLARVKKHRAKKAGKK